MKTQLLIDGEWRPASDGATIVVTDPASEETIAEVASATAEDCLAAVDAAHRAGKTWAARPPRERGEVLRRTFELLTKHLEDIATLIVRENGKSLRDARGEALYAAEFFRWYSEEAVRNIGELSIAPNGSNRILVVNQPIGVSLLVTPWNFPAAMATRKIGPALAAGCAVVLKPASETPLTALLIADLMQQAGVPKGVVNVVPSNRSGAVVSAMLGDSRVRKLSFTGSTEVGRILLAEASRTIVSCAMELGGNAPFVVFDDADLDAAIDGAMIAKMRNGGEACTAANRFYVHERVADQFSSMLAKRMKALKVGPGLEPDVDLGPLVNAKSREKVHSLVEEAVSRGAETLTGGSALQRKGYFYLPTVLGNVKPGSDLLSQEIFGPVAPVVTFREDDEAVEYANDSEYGLASYVYTRDLKRGLAICERIESGMIGLNRGLVSDPAAPFGGVKQSGLGREGAHEGMLEFMEKKYIATDW